MKKIFLIVLVLSLQSFAITTEIGASYSYSKKSFNASNYYQQDSKAASVSLSFWEKFALELSYTDQFYESQESDSTSTRTVQQSSKIYGTDLIYVILDQKNSLQPYIKAGGAYIIKKKQIKYVNVDVIDIPTKDGLVPSYGIGLKYKLTEKFSINLGYDIWSTPLDDGSKSDDASFKAGVKWSI